MLRIKNKKHFDLHVHSWHWKTADWIRYQLATHVKSGLLLREHWVLSTLPTVEDECGNTHGDGGRRCLVGDAGRAYQRFPEGCFFLPLWLPALGCLRCNNVTWDLWPFLPWYVLPNVVERNEMFSQWYYFTKGQNVVTRFLEKKVTGANSCLGKQVTTDQCQGLCCILADLCVLLMIVLMWHGEKCKHLKLFSTRPEMFHERWPEADVSFSVGSSLLSSPMSLNEQSPEIRTGRRLFASWPISDWRNGTRIWRIVAVPYGCYTVQTRRAESIRVDQLR